MRSALLFIFLFASFGFGAPKKVHKHKIPLPPIYIDHAYVQVDDATYAAIPNQLWLEDLGIAFCEYDKKVSNWQAHYIEGRRGYLEIFAKSKLEYHPDATAVSTIGFYTEKKGSIKNIQQALSELNPNDGFTRIDNEFSHQSYTSIGGFATWVMEPKAKTIGGKSIRREAWSSSIRKKAEVEEVPKIDYIKRIDIELAIPEKELLERTLRTLGYPPLKERDTYKGPETVVHILTATSVPRGIQKLTFQLKSPVKETKEVKVGSWLFSLHGPEAYLAIEMF